MVIVQNGHLQRKRKSDKCASLFTEADTACQISHLIVGLEVSSV
jgi:hypothetical protein